MVLAGKLTLKPVEQNRKHRATHEYMYGQLIFDNNTNNIPWAKNNLFNTWCWEN